MSELPSNAQWWRFINSFFRDDGGGFVECRNKCFKCFCHTVKKKKEYSHNRCSAQYNYIVVVCLHREEENDRTIVVVLMSYKRNVLIYRVEVWTFLKNKQSVKRCQTRTKLFCLISVCLFSCDHSTVSFKTFLISTTFHTKGH